MLVDSVRIDGKKLSFQMELSLVGDVATGSQRADSELTRRTAVGVLFDGNVDGDLLVLWAGAKGSEWDAGDGALLERAVATFSSPR